MPSLVQNDALPAVLAAHAAAQGGGLAFFGNVPGQIVTFDADEEIHGEGEPATKVYLVISGTVRAFSVLPDGRRQVEGFYFPGDILGLDAASIHRLSAEAVCEARLVVFKRSQIDAVTTSNCVAAHELWRWTARALEKAQAQMLLLGRKSALEKVATFLLDMAHLQANRGAIELPMNRSDIADYLGLTVETVSRTLSQLERDGAISVPASRRIVLRNSSRLAGLTA